MITVQTQGVGFDGKQDFVTIKIPLPKYQIYLHYQEWEIKGLFESFIDLFRRK